MRLVAHLSDIHFGAIDHHLVEPLIRYLNKLRPDVIAVSGDLTQRARSYQFKAARAFLDALPQPQIVVPGNHDISAHNLFDRFLRPLHKYRHYITTDLCPFFADEELAITGINTARSLVIKGGRINEDQINYIREKLEPLSDDVTKIVVTHHPFDLPEGFDEDDIVGRARLAMERLANSGIDLFLAGHMHISYTGHTAKRYHFHKHSALVVQAGTATSHRGRGEANSFNLIRVAHPQIGVERHVWSPERRQFEPASIELFTHTESGWSRLTVGNAP
jgi:3',5'-cyclic AMP phosphodiesterase CpdA